jgi:ADP-ribose pyrophosphatase YjhB (NUDIX family)
MTPGDEPGTQPGIPDGDPRSWPVERTESFGGVVVRDGADGPEVLLIKPRTDDGKIVWALPKGAREDGESPQDAAVREVFEETGIAAEIIGELAPVTYWFSWAPERVRYRKTVHYFLMRPVGDTVDPQPDGFEVAEARFVLLGSAPRKATYPSERKVLTAARAAV